jgi:acyl transferase domain-containing protein
MDIHLDPVAIIGTACRLPGSVHTLTQLWPLLCRPVSTSTPAPKSRGFESLLNPGISLAGWLPPSSLEAYDPEFFRITPGEANHLRPNIRLALELTYEAFQNAGINPGLLKGKNVSVNIAMGTEDGWEIKRFAEDGTNAFDSNWAQNSDPSAVPGRVAHFFDFQGPISSVSGACAGGGNALDSGILIAF